MCRRPSPRYSVERIAVEGHSSIVRVTMSASRDYVNLHIKSERDRDQSSVTLHNRISTAFRKASYEPSSLTTRFIRSRTTSAIYDLHRFSQFVVYDIAKKELFNRVTDRLVSRLRSSEHVRMEKYHDQLLYDIRVLTRNDFSM